MSSMIFEKLDALFEGKDSAIARDLRLNLRRILEEGSLPPEESLPALMAVSSSVQDRRLMAVAREAMIEKDFSEEQIREAEESAAIMAMLNTYYRFRHMVGKDDDYRTAGLRMTALARPVLGKERFEMLALAVSILNGCESCIKAHEKVLRDAGISADKVHDLARLAAVTKGIRSLF